MKFQITLFLFCISTFIFAQNSASLDLIVGVENNYRTAVVGNPNDNGGQFGYRFGINYNKQLAKKFYLKTGLRAINISYQTEKIALLWGSEIEAGIAAGTGPILDPTLPHEIQFFYNNWFLEIPLIGRFEFSDSRWSPFVEAGISPNMYLNSTVREETDLGERTYEGNTSNKFQLVASVSFGVNYLLNDNLQFFGQPVFRYHLSKLGNSSLNEHLYNVGMEVGVRKRL